MAKLDIQKIINEETEASKQRFEDTDEKPEIQSLEDVYEHLCSLYESAIWDDGVAYNEELALSIAIEIIRELKNRREK